MAPKDDYVLVHIAYYNQDESPLGRISESIFSETRRAHKRNKEFVERDISIFPYYRRHPAEHRDAARTHRSAVVLV